MAIDLKSVVLWAWGFKSPQPHHYSKLDNVRHFQNARWGTPHFLKKVWLAQMYLMQWCFEIDRFQTILNIW